MFEIPTLQQTHKVPPIPVVLVGASYWTSLINFNVMIENGLLAEADLKLFEIVDDAGAAWTSLTKRGLAAAHASAPSMRLDASGGHQSENRAGRCGTG